MKRYILLSLCIALSAGFSFAQMRVNTSLNLKADSFTLPNDNVASSRIATPNSSVPIDPITPVISIAGAYDIGLASKWHLASNGGPLHNIQVDPSDPQKIHVCIMGAQNTTEDDTTTANFFPNRRVFYFYSADGGQTWTAPKPISNFRTGYPNMMLIQRGSDYVPVIAAHRNDSEVGSDVTTFLYIETGAPGAGSFKEVAASRETYGGINHDIIWPAIALSKDGTKILTIASVSTTLSSLLTSIQFGVFTLNETKTNATWSGWLPGPGPGETSSISSGGYYAIRVAPSGKVGVVWKNYDSDTPDLGLYLSESMDNGATWSAAENIFYSRESGQASQDGTPMNIVAESGLDFFYNGEDANVLFSGYARTTIVDANNQIWSQPGSGTLLFWKKGMVDPRYLVSAFVDEVIPGPELESSFLAAWQPGTLDFQGVNLRHPVVAQSADPSKYSVYFSAIATDDFGTVTEFQEPDRNPTDKLAFMSIWKITSLDGGATFTNPVKVAGNEDGMPQELRLDYRFPQSSYFNPEGGGKALDRIMFSVDTCPGLPAEGYVGFNDMHWMTMQVSTSGVKAPVTFGTTISLGQNYPNPSLSGKTLIPFELTNSGEVVMTVTDLIGREVMTLTPGRMEAGKQTLPVDISRLTNGVYQYTLRSGGETLSRLMTIVKD